MIVVDNLNSDVVIMTLSATEARPQTRKFMQYVQPTGRERYLREDEIIVSKTNTRGVITYANQVFLRIADLTEAEAIGAPHSIIRHPDMPRGVFHLLWDRIAAGKEIFAYVVNLAKTGDHYWVFAHVTPSFDVHGNIIGYHSNRRAPNRVAVEKVSELYAELNDIEARASNKAEAISNSVHALSNKLKTAGLSYDELVFSL